MRKVFFFSFLIIIDDNALRINESYIFYALYSVCLKWQNAIEIKLKCKIHINNYSVFQIQLHVIVFINLFIFSLSCLNELRNGLVRQNLISMIKIPFFTSFRFHLCCTNFMSRFINPQLQILEFFVFTDCIYWLPHTISFRLWSINNANDGGRRK